MPGLAGPDQTGRCCCCCCSWTERPQVGGRPEPVTSLLQNEDETTLDTQPLLWAAGWEHRGTPCVARDGTRRSGVARLC